MIYLTRSEVIAWAVTIALVLLILLLQPALVGGAKQKVTGTRFCSGRGHLSKTDGTCVCIDRYYGDNCQYKYCPFGKSWLAQPLVANQRNEEFAPCSDMGFCDPYEGVCSCREGFEGRACERIACPRLGYREMILPLPSSVFRFYTPNASGIEFNAEQIPQSDFNTIAPCSGHGRCRTMAEAGLEFNGLTLTRPPVIYNNWDADKIQGCLCDDGYTGYDCSYRTCPFGRDPLLSKFDKNEVLTLQCKASSGYFSILAFGKYTPPIPFDADPGYLKFALETIKGVGTVEVIMEQDSDGLPYICSSNQVMNTKIKFLSNPGSQPPIFVTTKASNSRMWPNGGNELALAGSTVILRMATVYTLTCPVCSACFGSIYLTYGDSLSHAIDVTMVGAKTIIAQEIMRLGDFLEEEWTGVSVTVTSSGPDKICSSSAVNILTIHIYSDYGNLPAIGLLDSSYYSTASASKQVAANITLSSNKGNGTLYECSNQGVCNHASGMCECSQRIESGTFLFRAMSSDGNNLMGAIGDCGYLELKAPRCLIDGRICSGHGNCIDTSGLCDCFDGWFGVTCGMKGCPLGRAFFDEPRTANSAHQMVECSNNGICSRIYGECTCRKGFIGRACEIRDCMRDPSTGEACSGHGWCLSMAQIFEYNGLTYGDRSRQDGEPQAWDGNIWNECLCAAKTSSGFLGKATYSIVGPKGMISGYEAYGAPMSGFGGYDCSLRNCPKGDNINNMLTGGENHAFETQRVVCYGSGYKETSAFALRIFNQTSDIIYGNYNAAQIKIAIENIKSIGSVTVYFNTTDRFNDKACLPRNATYPETAGFFVQFNTELGDIEMMQVVAVRGTWDVKVFEDIKGAKWNIECGGPAMGMCDRKRGVCVCNNMQGSSDGTNNEGTRGDCGWRMPQPITRPSIDKEDIIF